MQRHVLPLSLATLAAIACPFNDQVDDAGPDCVWPVERVDMDALDQAPPICAGERGNGAFGEWFLDEFDQPAWRVLASADDVRWEYPTSRGVSTDVWHHIGNRRLNVLAHLDGAIELFAYPVSPTWLNKRLEDHGQTGGGWALVDAGTGEIRLGGGPDERVVWGDGYVSIERSVDGLVLRRYYYQDEDDASLLVETRIEETRGETRSLRVTDLWDYHLLYQIMFPLSGGEGLQLAWDSRFLFGERFRSTARHDANGIAVSAERKPGQAPSDAHAPLPGEFLLKAQRPVATCHDASYAEGCPTGNGEGAAENLSEFLLTLTDTQPLEAGGTYSMVHRVGFGQRGRWDGAGAFPTFAEAQTARFEAARDERLVLAVNDAPWVARETLWHSRQLMELGLENERFGVNLIDQGSAYLYLQGLSGAVRDWIITGLAVLPVSPDRARDMMKMGLGFSDPTGHLFYAMRGASEPTEAAIHYDSTDLDLWVLWGVAEYALATRDFAFLDAPQRFFPPEDGEEAPVLEHLRRHLAHLRDTTGTGEHGMIRVGTGDWSDGVALFAPDFETVVTKGESGFNTGMAVYVLPRLAEAVADRDPELAAEAMRLAGVYGEALEASWIGDRYLRGWDGEGGAIGGADRFFLESQLFPLMAGHGGPERAEALSRTIGEQLDERSDIGAVLVYPPQGEGVAELLVPGWDVNGGIWHAMNMLLTTGYAGASPDCAWASWLENTFASHAEAYPGIWHGVVSGPDSYNAPYALSPGHTFYHPATSMADFPVSNSNAHAGPLFAAFRLAGAVPGREGWSIDPKIPQPVWRLDSALATMVSSLDGMAARFASAKGTPLRFRVHLPEGTSVFDGPDGLTVEDGWATFTVTPDAKGQARWSLGWE